MPDLRVSLGNSLQLQTPLVAASGTFGYGKEYADLVSFDDIGAIAVKGISTCPALGNDQPRSTEVFGGMLNSIGLQNPGVDEFLYNPDYLPWLSQQSPHVIVNIWGTTVQEYKDVAEQLVNNAAGKGIDALEINVSCPNIKKGGAAFGTDLSAAQEVVRAVREVAELPLITKLSPDVSRIGDFAKAVADAGTDIISSVNTIPAMAIDPDTGRPRLSTKIGGLSGPCMKPIALRKVYETACAVDVPIIGMGGICNASDAVEFFMAGADAVGIGTAVFRRPDVFRKIIKGLEAYLEYHGCQKVQEFSQIAKV